jgi:hypothetical protein
MSESESTAVPEPPAPRPDALEEHEVAGVVSILIKTIIYDDRIRENARLVETLNATLAADRLNRAKGANALSIYGFDPQHPKIWATVREVIGNDRYNQAIGTAQGLPTPIAKEPPREDVEDGVDPSQSGASGEGEVGSSASMTPKISDAILAFLKDQGRQGAKVAAVKEHLSKAYGIETHEKTPGMTLYRLFKGGKVSRDGRIWFYVDPSNSGKTEDPGGETPGHIGSENEEEAAEC